MIMILILNYYKNTVKGFFKRFFHFILQLYSLKNDHLPLSSKTNITGELMATPPMIK